MDGSKSPTRSKDNLKTTFPSGMSASALAAVVSVGTELTGGAAAANENFTSS